MPKCRICRQPFEKRNMAHRVCGIRCAVELAKLDRDKQNKRKAQAERKELKVRKDALKTRSDWLKDAQTAFNAYIRERDKDKPCICCGVAQTKVNGHRAHGWDCGHYRSTGSAPHLRFDERNAHRQLVFCNRYGAGRAVDYRIGLIARIGLQAVEALEADQTPRKFMIAELKAIKAEYKAKLKALQVPSGYIHALTYNTALNYIADGMFDDDADYK